MVRNEDSEDYSIKSLSLLRKIIHDKLIVDIIIPRINYHAINLKSIEQDIVVTDVHCS